ncbi:MAG: GNAT family N-acetyltransferase [Pseudomonadales bacterium]
MTLRIVTAGPADFSAMLALNESCVPHVNSIDEQEIGFFCDLAKQFVKVVEEGTLAGYVIALGSGLEYKSANYRWFNAHLSKGELGEFLYIDRIMVHPDFRRRGIASLIYDHLEASALDQGLKCLCCEVNLKPANPESLALHKGMGFVEQATQKTEGGAKEVSLLVKQLETTEV